MRKPFKKSTISDIEQMFKWHKAGISTNEIGRRLKKDHASVIYWLKKSPEYIKGISGRIPLLKVPKLEWHGVSVDKLIAERKEEEALKSSNHCIVCRKDKSNVWRNTNFCGLKCWDLDFRKQHHKLLVY